MRRTRVGVTSAIIDISMAQLLVRDLPPELVRRLKRRAAANGRSAEAEHRAILHDVLLGPAPSRSFKEQLLAMPEALTDDDLAVRRERARRVKL